MKKNHLLTFVLAIFFITIALHGIEVNAAIGGDEVCGGTSVTYGKDEKGNTIITGGACGLADFKKIWQGIFSLIISIGLPLLIVFVIYRFVMAWYSLQQGNANAYKEATKKAGQAIFGFMIVVAIMGGLFIVMLNYLGVDTKYMDLLKKISEVFVTHAYAATTTETLPSPIGATSLYEFILTVLGLVMRFFIYPALIAMWVWSGFSYVLAQGAPEKLSKTHKLIMWAFISTLIVFMTQALLSAIKGSVDEILPKTVQEQQFGIDVVV